MVLEGICLQLSHELVYPLGEELLVECGFMTVRITCVCVCVCVCACLWVWLRLYFTARVMLEGICPWTCLPPRKRNF